MGDVDRVALMRVYSWVSYGTLEGFLKDSARVAQHLKQENAK